MGCQKRIVEQIAEQEADYVITLKKNQKTLYQKVENLFISAIMSKFQGLTYSEYRLVEDGHGRKEIRYYSVLNNIKDAIAPDSEWMKLYSIGKVDSVRIIKGKTKLETRYYISSLNHDAKSFSESVRTHWQIENCWHWILDVQFNEDDSRIRKDNAPANFAVLRHIAYSLLTQEKSLKVGVKNKRKKAGWDNDYLLKILTS